MWTLGTKFTAQGPADIACDDTKVGLLYSASLHAVVANEVEIHVGRGLGKIEVNGP